MWVVLEAAGGSQDSDVLIRFGAKYAPAIADGEYWRLVAPIFLHIGAFHLLANSIGLLIFGRIVETGFGTRIFVTIYLLSGVFGNVASYAFGPALGVGAGASGAIFGIVGAYAAYLAANRSALGGLGGSSLLGLGALIAVNLVFGFSIAGIDNWAHLGGLASGFVIAWRLTPRARLAPIEAPFGVPTRYAHVVSRAASTRTWLAVAAIGVLAIGVAVWAIGHGRPYSPTNLSHQLLAEATELLDEGKLAEAEAVVGEAVRLDRTELGNLYLIRGLVAVRNRQYRRARLELEAALRFGLTPANENRAREALRGLGVRR